MEKIVALCKNRGFVFPGSEIYGGLANSWDYGPLGVEMKNNVKRAWWKKFVQENPYNVGLDSAILMNPQVWVASGHVSTFNDPLIDCKACKMRHRADKLVESYVQEHGMDVNVEAMTQEELVAFIREMCIRDRGHGSQILHVGTDIFHLAQGAARRHKGKGAAVDLFQRLPPDGQTESVHRHHSQALVRDLEQGTSMDGAALIGGDSEGRLLDHGTQQLLLDGDGKIILHHGQLRVIRRGGSGCRDPGQKSYSI